MQIEKEVPKHLRPLSWARTEWVKGVKERSGKQHNPRIVWYHSFTTLKATDDETPWCSSFMCAAAESGGYPSTRSAAAISWETYGEEVHNLAEAQQGDILVFKRKDASNPRARHVAFLYRQKTSLGGVILYCLGGNQKNSVSVAQYPVSELVAIRRFPS